MAQDDFFDFDNTGYGYSTDLPQATDTVNPSAVLSSSTGLDALRDPQFISELMEYYGKKDAVEDPADFEALIDEFYSDQTWDAMNSIAAIDDIIETKGMDERQVLLKGRIKQVYDSLPNFYEEGGRGLSGFAQNAFAALADPINLVGFGSGAVAAKTAMRASTAMTQRQALGRAARAGAIGEGVAGVGIGATQDFLQQQRDLATGIQGEYDLGKTAFAAGAEGILGAGLGSLFGIAGGAAAIQAKAGPNASTTSKIGSAVLAPARAAGRGFDVIADAFGKQFTIQAENARLGELGYTPDNIAQLINDAQKEGMNAKAEIATILKNSIPAEDYMVRKQEGNAEGIELPSQEEIDAVGQEIDPSDPRFGDLQMRLAEATSKIQARQMELQDELGTHRAAGDTEQEAQVSKELATIIEMEGLASRIANYEAEINTDLQSPDANTRAKAKKRAIDLRKLVADFDNFSRSGEDVDAQAVIEGDAALQATSTNVQPEAPAPTPTATQAVDAPPADAQAPTTPAEQAPAATPDNYPRAFLVSLDELMKDYDPADPNRPKDYKDLDIPDEDTYIAIVAERVRSERQANPKKVGDSPASKTVLPDDMFTTPAVQGMAQNALLTSADFDGVKPSAKSGKYSVKDVKQIIASKEGQTPEPVASQPATAPEVVEAPVEAPVEVPAEEVAPTGTSPIQYVFATDEAGTMYPALLDRASGTVIARMPDGSAISAPQDQFNVTPIEVKYRSKNQKEAIQKTLAEINRTEDDIVEGIAQGIIPVSKDGTLKQIKRENLINALSQFDSPEAGVDDAFIARSERVLTALDKELNGELGTLVQLVPDEARKLIIERDPQQGARIFDELIEGLDNDFSVKNNQKGEEIFGGAELTSTEKKKVARIQKAMVASGIPEQFAKLSATVKVLKQRGTGIEKSSGDLTGPLANPPIETTAGRTTFNKIQGFLKRGDFIGRAPNVPEGLDPDTDIIYGFDNAVNAANKLIEEEYEIKFDVPAPTDENPNAVREVVQTRTRYVKSTATKKYVSTGGEAIADGNGSLVPTAAGKKNIIKPEYAKEGDDLFYDPITNKAYRHEANMRMARGEGPNQTHYQSTDTPVDTDKQVLESALDRYRQDGDLSALGNALKQTGKNSLVPVTNNVPDVPVLNTNGKRLALRNKETGKIRVIGQNQIDEGKGLEALLGKADIEDFEIGHTKGARNSEKSIEEFEPWSPDAIKRVYLTAQQASQQAIEMPPAKFVQEMEGLASLIEGMPMTPENRELASSVLDKFIRDAGHVDKLMFDDGMDTIEHLIGWPRTGQGGLVRSYTEFFTAFHTLKKTIMPDDIRKPGDSLGQAKRRVQQIFKGKTKSEIEALNSVLETIAEQNDGVVPKFVDEEGAFNKVFSSRSALETNTISLGSKNTNFVNQAMHELGHWAYTNMLTPEDKLAFWKAAQGYIDANGVVDEGRLGQSISDFNNNPNVSQNPRTGVMRFDGPDTYMKYGTNTVESPQEWFANQFANWAMNERLSPEFREESYWTNVPLMASVAKYVKSVVDFFINRKSIDPALVPLFTKILPDEVQAAALADGVNTPVTPAGQALHRTIIDLTMTHDDLLEAVTSNNDEMIIMNADLLARRLYGIAAPSQARSQKTGQAGKPFMLMGRTHKLAQTLYQRIFDALGEDVSALSPSEVENLGFSYGANSTDVMRQADKIREIVLGNRTDDLDPKYETTELIEIILSDAQKVFNSLTGEPSKMTGGYAGVEFAPKKPMKPYAKYSKMLREGTRKKKRIQEKRTKETRSNADAARLNKSPTTAQIDDSHTVDYRMATPTQLADDLAKYGETDYGRMVARQMKENERSAPLNADVPPQLIDSQWTIDAIAKEVEETRGVSLTNISPGARQGINVAQEQLSHRDIDKLNISRTIFYRLANITGAKRPTRRMQLALLGVSDVNEVAQRIQVGSQDTSYNPTLAPSEYLDEYIEVKGEEFDSLRKKLRSLATNLSPKSPNATGQKNAKQVIKDVVRTIVILDPTQTMHQDIWRRYFGPGPIGQGLPVTQANWDKALNDLVEKTSKNLTGTDPYEETDAFVHTVKQVAAYVLNGQMDDRIKKAHPVLDAYGNVFNGQSLVHRSKMSIDSVFYPSRYDDEPFADYTNLSRVSREYWNNSSQARRDAINEFTGNRDPNEPPTLYVLPYRHAKGTKPHVVGERGIEPQVITDQRYGNGTRIQETQSNTPIFEQFDTYVGAMREAGAEENIIERFIDLQEVYQIIDDAHLHMDGQLARREAEGLNINDLNYLFDNGMMNLNSSKATVLGEMSKILDAYGVEMVDGGEGYHPVYMGPAEIFDFTIDKDYGADDLPALEQILFDIDPNGKVDTQSVASMIGSRGYITGDALHMEFIDTIKEVALATAGRPISNVAAAEKLNHILRAYDYDGIRGHGDDTTFNMLFKPEGLIKHAMADDFDLNNHIVGYLYQKTDVSSTNGQVIRTMQELGGMSENQTVTMQEQLHEAGVASNAVSGIGQIARGKTPNKREAGAIRRAFNIGLGENSFNLRRYGLSWIADWMAPARMEGTGHYERLAARTSNHLAPIFEALAGLEGGGGIKNWMRKASDFRLGTKGVHHALGVEQPRSYIKIVNAIRRGPESAAAQKLTRAERYAFDRIQKTFKNIHYELVEAGVMVGRVKDYFPQVWSVEKIQRNPDGFKQALARYFISESQRFRNEEITGVNAMERANRVYLRLIEEDGVYTPSEPSQGSRDATGDHIDYQRLIRLDEFKEHLDDVGLFLEDDLEAIVSKYADNAVRRVDLTEKFGNESHAFHDYMSVVSNPDMESEIAKLLSTPKISRKTIINPLESTVDETLEIRRESRMPFHEDNAGAREAAKTILRLADKGEAALRQFMDSLESSAGEPAFAKRADAIIGAVLDRQKMSGPLDMDQQKFAQDSFRSMQRKSNTGGGTFAKYTHSGSKFIRNLNAITLLGNTVLTSLGDAVLPLVRSGSLAAYSKAMAQYMGNPHYRRMVRNIGAALENQIHERMTGLYGTDASRNTTAFFNATLLSPWTGFWRNASSAVGMEWFKAEYNIALTNFDPRKELREQNGKFGRAYRILRAYGLDELLATNERIDNIDSFLPSPTDSPQRAEAKARVQEAVIKFANQTIFTPNPNDIPLFAQGPIGQVVYQLKSFPIMMGRLSYDVGRLAITADPVTKKGRRFKPALMLATVAPLAGGGVANYVKDIAQARGEDNEREVRDRSFNEIAEQMGWDARIHRDVYGIDADAWAGWYIEGMMQMGGMGLLADLFYQTAEQADNGVYGRARLMSVFGGPTVGLANDVFTIGQGLADDHNDGKNHPERSAARAIATRIPVLGGHRDVREKVVDVLGGQKRRPGGRRKSHFLKAWKKD